MNLYSAPSPAKKPSRLSSPILQQLNFYAVAASATGVAMLAGAQPAAAEIVYTPAHETILTNHKFSLDLNHDGIADFIISNHAFCTTDICGRTLRVLPQSAGNGVLGMKSVFILEFASALNRGAKIGTGGDFRGKLMAVSGTEYGSGGQWMNVTERYLGLKFSIDGATHYGWARFNVRSVNQRITAQLTGYAYETTANTPIVAGKTSGSTDVEAIFGSPTGKQSELDVKRAYAKVPAAMGLLALGSIGLPFWRRTENN